jgi:hypothetical protein
MDNLKHNHAERAVAASSAAKIMVVSSVFTKVYYQSILLYPARPSSYNTRVLLHPDYPRKDENKLLQHKYLYLLNDEQVSE